MTHVVTKITCTDCEHKFDGILYEIFMVNKQYAAQCPECDGTTFFSGVSDFIDTEIPKGAVEIKRL